MRLLRVLHKVYDIARCKSIFFQIDRKFYLKRNPDLKKRRLHPFLHYVLWGWKEGRDPVPWFSTTKYLDANPDVVDLGINPFLHYLQNRKKEGRLIYSAIESRSLAFQDFKPDRNVNNILKIKEYFLAEYDQGGKCSIEDFPEKMDELVALEGDAHLLPDEVIPLAMHMSIIFDYFDPEFYLKINPDVARAGVNPLFHYCTRGWWELRRPNEHFDLWWYWSTYLNIKVDVIDPLLHFLLVGKERGYYTENTSPISLREKAIEYAPRQRIKRICLFAAYDIQGIVDDYVVLYLKELSKFSDIYYLADCEMKVGELDKLKGIVRQAWAIRHGEYDFGSYSRLARDLVGWDIIDQYDELILANDSCYLLKSLDDVFCKMDAQKTDWWGMQATQGMSVIQDDSRTRFVEPIPLDTIKEKYLDSFEDDPVYSFHIGSYFLVYRKDIINDKNFRKIINSIVKQKSKLLIIKKYEIGFTRHLIQAGYQFSTYIDDLYPFHPIYTNNIFKLIEEGFPFFKRFLLSENHYYVAGLDKWKEKIHRILPDADLNVLEKNLYRVSNAEKLFRSLRVVQDGRPYLDDMPLYANREIEKKDLQVEKHDFWWAFPVCSYDHTFTGNERAVFEYVKNDPRIKKIILIRSKYVNVDGENVVVLPLKSREGQELLMRSRVIFLKHTVSENVGYALSKKEHYFINLWHGIPLKRIGYTSRDHLGLLKQIETEHERMTAVISSSKIDTLAMSASFFPLSYHDVWMTGLPRNDFIMDNYNSLPSDFREQEDQLRKILDGKKLILFFPTFRKNDESYYNFSEDELTDLSCWLKDNNAVLGIREHMAAKSKSYASQIKGHNIMNLSSLFYKDIEVLYRVSSALITDYSSCFVDYILTNKHLISFAYDLADYENTERGTFYDLDFCFPGDICHTFGDVIASLERAVKNDYVNSDSLYKWKKKLFFEYDDTNNSRRVVEKVKTLIEGGSV